MNTFTHCKKYKVYKNMDQVYDKLMITVSQSKRGRDFNFKCETFF